MKNRFYIAHDIPGRLRLIVPALAERNETAAIMQLFSALNGIKNVRIERAINSLLLEYDSSLVNRNRLLQYVSVFFNQTEFHPLDNLMARVQPNVRKNLFLSMVSGLLLFTSLLRNTANTRPDLLDYTVVISTAYTVLSHGGTNKIRHPDVIAGIVGMLSMGPNNILQASAVSWGVNLLEILFEMSRGSSIRV